uniref:Reverse transcriptase zinc-binding domain-containing protein n=1 Tax=Photinus pyralis TaxID=7054 RepID=A0A1Y1KI79_PHOPY
MTIQDILIAQKTSLINQWQSKWTETTQKLTPIKPNVRRWKQRLSNRKYDVTLTRLRLGHTKLTHKHLLQKAETPQCEKCNVDLTIKHLLIDCPHYQNTRTATHLPDALEVALNPEKTDGRTVIAFLDGIQMTKQI